MNLGLGAGTQVITNEGDRNLESITTSERVLTSFGQYSQVKNTGKTIYRGTMLIFEVFGKPNLTCSLHTKVYSLEGEQRVWKEASEIKAKDLICHLSTDIDGKISSEWVKVRKVLTISGACRYLYGIDVAEGASFTADGYIISTN